MDEAEVPGTDEVLTHDQRVNLAEQLARLNENLERQFALIAQQQASDRRAARRRWFVVMLVALLIAGGNVRVEMVRREQRDRDRTEAKAVALAACRRTNTARLELRSSFDYAFATVEDVASAEAKPLARQARDDVREDLARSLPIIDCSAPEPEPLDEFSSCAEAEAAGAAPLRRGDPGYSASLDRDGDGIACE